MTQCCSWKYEHRWTSNGSSKEVLEQCKYNGKDKNQEHLGRDRQSKKQSPISVEDKRAPGAEDFGRIKIDLLLKLQLAVTH